MSLATNVSMEMEGYHVALEDVLTWLLDAEEQLNHMPDMADNVAQLKEQFCEHKLFVMKLSNYQSTIGAVLQEGTRLLNEGNLRTDEESEVRIQMSLVNSQWERLRTHAMDKFMKMHKVMNKEQQFDFLGVPGVIVTLSLFLS